MLERTLRPKTTSPTNIAVFVEYCSSDCEQSKNFVIFRKFLIRLFLHVYLFSVENQQFSYLLILYKRTILVLLNIFQTSHEFCKLLKVSKLKNNPKIMSIMFDDECLKLFKERVRF